MSGWRNGLGVLARGSVAGLAGTTVMTATAALYARLAPPVKANQDGVAPVADFDNSQHVVVAASTVLRLHPRTERGRTALFRLVHWGYGSVVGAALPALRRAGAPAPGLLFFVGCQTMAATLFPLAGGTPPPWRWSRRQLTVSVAQHAIYAITVAVTERRLARRLS